MSPGTLVMVRVGAEGKGTQLALVLEERGDQLRVVKWKAASKAWTCPTWVDVLVVAGGVTTHDVRRGPALRSIGPDLRALVAWTNRGAA